MALSEEQLAAIRERSEKATPGPWEARHEQAASGIFAPSEVTPLSMHGKARIVLTGGLVINNHEADAKFIAHVRDDVPALLAEVVQLRAFAQKVIDHDYNPWACGPPSTEEARRLLGKKGADSDAGCDNE